MSDDTPKLRMAAPESAEQLARRVERDRLTTERQREQELEQSLKPFRVGSVPYLNAVPATRGLEDEIQFVTPSKLAEMLRRDELDAALVSVTEVLLNDRYDVLDGVAIASLGEVKSVFVAHRYPLAEVREIFCDAAAWSGCRPRTSISRRSAKRPSCPAHARAARPCSSLKKRRGRSAR